MVRRGPFYAPVSCTIRRSADARPVPWRQTYVVVLVTKGLNAMKTVVSVIQPVEADICRECRFCSHILELEPPDVGSPTIETLVCCLRGDCDNAHAERLRPLVSRKKEPKRASEPPRKTHGSFVWLRGALASLWAVFVEWNNSFVRYPEHSIPRWKRVENR